MARPKRTYTPKPRRWEDRCPCGRPKDKRARECDPCSRVSGWRQARSVRTWLETADFSAVPDRELREIFLVHGLV